MRKIGACVIAINISLFGLSQGALAATWHGTRGDAKGMTKAVKAAEAGTDPLAPYFGCYKPVGYERLVDVWVSNNQREAGIDYVGAAYQRPPRNAQGCSIIFEHSKGGVWHVLSFGTSPCEGGSKALRAACKAIGNHYR